MKTITISDAAHAVLIAHASANGETNLQRNGRTV